ncbi:hypothetical protein E2C01_068652 [Portunus trituberculatus]|uniref:Secreted protein n=1 Tax=Portunus trituberculatus TaxID=210409 RepID=A0A5B7HWR0_PORTR|nr:hypothetical protein [Portunus trituberculatus]
MGGLPALRWFLSGRWSCGAALWCQMTDGKLAIGTQRTIVEIHYLSLLASFRRVLWASDLLWYCRCIT